MNELLKHKMEVKTASMYGLRGMLVGFLYLLISFIVSIIFGGESFLGKVIRIIDWPIMYAIAGNIFDFLVKIGLARVHDVFFCYSVILIVYLVIGYLFGCFYYFIRKFFNELKGKLKK